MRAERVRARVRQIAERHVLPDGSERRRALPHLVVLPAPAQLVRRRRPALERRAPQHERAVDENAVEPKRVQVRVLQRGKHGTVAQRDDPASELRGALGVEPPQEVANADGLELGHQRRPLARVVASDLLELGELVARSKIQVTVGKRVRPEHAARHQRGRNTRLDTTA